MSAIEMQLLLILQAMSASVMAPVDGVTLSTWFLEHAEDEYFEHEHMFWCFELSWVVFLQKWDYLITIKCSHMKKEVTIWLFS